MILGWEAYVGIASTTSHRRLLAPAAGLVIFCAAAGCTGAPDSLPESAGEVPREELRLASDEAAVLEAARALMVADRVVALVTVDAPGQPRVRSVRALLEPVKPDEPRSGFTVWVMTRFATRKVDQIRANPTVSR